MQYRIWMWWAWACNTSPQEAEAGDLQTLGQHGPHSKILPQKRERSRMDQKGRALQASGQNYSQPIQYFPFHKPPIPDTTRPFLLPHPPIASFHPALFPHGNPVPSVLWKLSPYALILMASCGTQRRGWGNCQKVGAGVDSAEAVSHPAARRGGFCL